MQISSADKEVSFKLPFTDPDVRVGGFDSNSKTYGPQSLRVQYDGARTRFEVYLNRFSDVPYGHVFYSSVMDLVNRDITQGYGGSVFGENDYISRAQIAVMLVRARSDLKPEGMRSDFTDVPAGYWAEGEIAAAKKSGILDGYGDGTFGPDDYITRAQLSKMVAKAFSIKVDAGNPVIFTDVPSNYWAKEYISDLASNQIVGGYGGGLFGPDDPASRGQFSKYLSNALNLDTE